MGYCNWDNTSEQNRRYHDEEWGVPLHDDRGQFEYLSLEVMQCGLSWDLMMRKREIFRECFENFEFDRIAEYGERDVERILATEGMIRSPRKVAAIIGNAQRFRQMREEFGSFDDWLWAHSDGKTILYNKHAEGYVPASNGLSAEISRELKRRGFKYLGPVVVYSHLQACGLINDHDERCPRRAELIAAHPTVEKRRHLEKDVRFYGNA